MHTENTYYRHYKGDMYQLVSLDVLDANNSASYKNVVVYKSVKTDEHFMRSEEEFFESVTVHGKSTQRFSLVPEQEVWNEDGTTWGQFLGANEHLKVLEEREKQYKRDLLACQEQIKSQKDRLQALMERHLECLETFRMGVRDAINTWWCDQ